MENSNEEYEFIKLIRYNIQNLAKTEDILTYRVLKMEER